MSGKVYVWDRFVRLFHWSLVGLFTLSYLTGEEETWVHIYSGYAIFALVIARVLWGLVGTRHARFKDFVRSPRTVIAYARDLWAGHPRRFLGHNPLGGAMVVCLLLALLTTTLSGMKLYAVEEGKGPFAGAGSLTLVNRAYADDDHEYEEEEEEEEFWEELHETAVNLTLLLVVLHIAGVAVSSLLHREALVRAMLTGYKDRS